MQQNAITFLHDLGLVLHFEELDLSEYFVLDPYWITYGVYQILTSGHAGEQKGRVAMHMLDYIVNEEEDKKQVYHPASYRRITYSPNEQRFLVDILHQFKLCFKLPNQEYFIIPDLLDTNEPLTVTEPIRNAPDAIRFVYRYRYLPKNIMPHIMVESHEILREMWRTGCVLETDGVRALISAYQNSITLIVAGEYKKKREFMAICRHCIDTINRQLSEPPKKMIPLPGVDAFVDYEELLEREADGEKTYKIFKPEKKTFDISELLEGVPSENEIRQLMEELGGIKHKIKGLHQDHLELQTGQQEIIGKLDDHYAYLTSLPALHEIRDGILPALYEITGDQSTTIAAIVLQRIEDTFATFDTRIDDRLTDLYTDLKKTDDVKMKLKLGLPLLSLLGINFETEFDLKNWAKKQHETHKLKIFELLMMSNKVPLPM